MGYLLYCYLNHKSSINSIRFPFSLHQILIQRKPKLQTFDFWQNWCENVMLILINIWCMHEMLCKIGQKKKWVWYLDFGPTQVKCRILSYRIFLRSHSQRFGKKRKNVWQENPTRNLPQHFFLLWDRTEIIQIISVRYKPVKDWQRKISFQIQQINSSDKKFSFKKNPAFSSDKNTVTCVTKYRT